MGAVITIQEAQREGARLFIGLSGPSGCGKTLSALLMAYGMAGGDGKKVGLLCTENRRGRLYACAKTYEMVRDQLGLSALPSPFMVADFEPPFSPQRYTEAIKAFQDFGVEVLVIDSVSHEWEGTGGCEEIAIAAGSVQFPNWAVAKREHKRFMNSTLQSDMHVIACIRAREKVKMGKDDRGKTTVTPMGMQPVCEKNFMFELTVSMMLWEGGVSRTIIKASGTDDIFGPVGDVDGYLTADHGRQLRAWVDGAKQLDPEVERGRNALRVVSEQGLTALEAAFKALPPKVKRALAADGSVEMLKRAAADFDKARTQPDPELSDMAGEILGGAGA